MKGIILAGGRATRLMPVTKVTNKHLLPVYDQPMIYYPLKTLIEAGVKDILIISGAEHAGHFLNLLGSGKDFGVELTYRVQDQAGGIAHALALAERFVGDDHSAVILGDNIFSDNTTVAKAIKEFAKEEKGARVFLKKVSDAQRFGVADVKGAKIAGIQEKPKKPKSNLAVTGLYLYDKQVFDVIRTLKPSGRGELEITDVNNFYIKQKTMGYQILKGDWTDAGTFPSLLRANLLAARQATAKKK